MAGSNHQSLDLPLSRRFAEAVVLACVLTVAYFGVGERMLPTPVPMAHAIDGKIPFVPASVWVYMPAYMGSFVLTLVTVRDVHRFRAALTAVGMLTVLAVPFFVLFPVAAPRPPAPAGASLTAEAVRWLYSTDPQGNTFPSLHVANATLCAFITTSSNRRWGGLAWLLAVSVWVSVLTLKQHWAVDVPAGLALAGVGGATWRAQLAAPSVLAGLPARLHRLHAGDVLGGVLRPLRVRINGRGRRGP